MLNENAKKLVAALRSGEYQQTTGLLHRTVEGVNHDKSTILRPAGYCCLGVACDLYAQDHPGFSRKPTGHYAGGPHDREVFDASTATLPSVVQQWLGFESSTGQYVDGNLAGLNDGGSSFEAIAAVIESEPLGLFVA